MFLLIVNCHHHCQQKCHLHTKVNKINLNWKPPRSFLPLSSGSNIFWSERFPKVFVSYFSWSNPRCCHHEVPDWIPVVYTQDCQSFILKFWLRIIIILTGKRKNKFGLFDEPVLIFVHYLFKLNFEFKFILWRSLKTFKMEWVRIQNWKI